MYGVWGTDLLAGATAQRQFLHAGLAIVAALPERRPGKPEMCV